MEQKNMGYPHTQQPYPNQPYPNQPYPNQPPSYSQVQPPAPTIIHAMPQVGPDSTRLVCPHCHAHIQTRVDSESTTRTHLIALFLCIFLCWPCVCVPYCMDSCKNANHYCPNCNAFIGTYQS